MSRQHGIVDPADQIKHVKTVANITITDNPSPKWRYLDEFYLVPRKINGTNKYRKLVLGQHVGKLMKQLKRKGMEDATEQGMSQDLLCLPFSDSSRS